MPNEPAPLLETVALNRTFGHGHLAVRAVCDVSLRILPGEVISIVGESGSGKTTLARMILGLLKPSSGTILFRGDPVRNDVAYRRGVQAVFQDPFASFNQFFSVRRTLEDSFRVLSESPAPAERDKRIRAALAEVNLPAEDVLAKYPFELSGGQMQRLLLARVLLIGPQLLIADEPTSMIDACSRATILALLSKLNRDRGMTLVYITHDIGLAYYVSDRLFIMNRGELVESGTADEILFAAKHEYTRRLIGDVPALSGDWP